MRFLRFIFRNHLRVATGLEPAARCCAGLNKLASGIGSGLIAALKAGTEFWRMAYAPSPTFLPSERFHGSAQDKQGLCLDHVCWSRDLLDLVRIS